MSAAKIIHECVKACAAEKDDRGRWRQVRACESALAELGASPAIAAATAAAAHRLGVCLSGAGQRGAQE